MWQGADSDLDFRVETVLERLLPGLLPWAFSEGLG